MAEGNSKRKRTAKKSAGERRSSRRVRLTELEKALMGGGLQRSTKVIAVDRKSSLSSFLFGTRG